MISQNHHRLVATNTQQQQILVDLNKWSLLGMGEGHIILNNNDPSDELYWNVIMICIHQIHSAPKPIQSLYFQLIDSVPNISKHLLHREEISFEEADRERIKMFVSNELKISHKLPQRFMVFLAQNLNRSKDNWQYTLQFKPKTPLPDKYSQSFFNQLCHKLQINPHETQSLLNNRPPQQKTRWFKKSSLKANKKNMNPLEIFGVLTEKAPQVTTKIKKMDTFIAEKQIPTNRQALNKSIFNKIISQQILSAVLAVQLLFVGPSDSVQTQFTLWDKQTNKQELISQIKESLSKVLAEYLNINPRERLEESLKSSIISAGNNKVQESERIEQMFRFLMSWSWRDVSLFIQLKLNSQQTKVQDIKFTIIDYQLKETSKLGKTIDKDEQFLKYYLKYLQVIS